MGTGKFYDEADIKEKYKNKRQRLDGILKNATRIICPVAGVEMIEDLEYKSVSTDTGKLTITQSCTAMTEDKVKKRKIAKPQKVKDALAEDEPTDLTDPQKKQLNEWLESQTKLVGKVEEFVNMMDDDDNKAWAAFIPDYVKRGLQTAKVRAEAAHASHTMIKEEGKVAGFKKISVEWKEAEGMLKEALRKAKLQGEEAEVASK